MKQQAQGKMIRSLKKISDSFLISFQFKGKEKIACQARLHITMPALNGKLSVKVSPLFSEISTNLWITKITHY